MTYETFLLTLVLTSLLILPLSFWLMTKTLNQATRGLVKQNEETSKMLSQAVNLLSTKDPIAFQQILAASGQLAPLYQQAPLVTDNYEEVDDDNEYDFAAVREEYGIK
jgi:ABC-type bacteriocin/lantibiotic exporter with double-glycine peptidase domain